MGWWGGLMGWGEAMLYRRAPEPRVASSLGAET